MFGERLKRTDNSISAESETKHLSLQEYASFGTNPKAFASEYGSTHFSF